MIEMDENKFNIMYVVSDLKRVGPSNQTLNIIKNSPIKENCLVVTLFKEPEDTMINEYKDNNIDIIQLNLNRISFIFNGVSVLRKYIQKYNIKIVHSYGVKPDYICQKAIEQMDGVEHVITLRNFPKEDIFTRMNYFKAIIAYKSHINVLLKGKNIIACSDTIKSKMKDNYSNMNISSIKNGVDIEKYTKINQQEKNLLREKFKINIEKKVYISTSSFIPRKRIDETIKSFELINNEDSILLLLGDGLQFSDIYKNYKTNKNIIFIGKTNKVKEYLQLSDYFLSSSESEGLPNGVIEAISTGLPVVLSDIPQHIEVLNEVENAGITYKLGNINDFSEKIVNIRNFDNSKCNISNSNLTMKNMSKKYFEYYLEIIGRNNFNE